MQGISGSEVRPTRLLFRHWLSAKINQNGTATNTVACFNVVENITDEPRMLQV